MHSYWQDLSWDCYTSFFAHLYQSYGPWFMHKFRFNSISWELIDKISQNLMYAYILTRSTLRLTNFIVNHLFQSYGTWFTTECYFHSISWEQIDRISPNFIYESILTRSSLGLLHIIFGSFVPELWLLIYAKISFPFNILRTYWQNFTKFDVCIHIDKIYVGISHNIFRTFVPELWPLICPKISFILDILRTNRHKFTKFYICINIDKI